LKQIGAYFVSDAASGNRDEKLSLYWYLRAAKHDHAEAQVCVGNAYRHGHGVAASREKAAYWFEKAASQKHLLAQYCTAEMHQGVNLNHSSIAYIWSSIAYKNGFEDALKLREAMANEVGISSIIPVQNNAKKVLTMLTNPAEAPLITSYLDQLYERPVYVVDHDKEYLALIAAFEQFV
jgi:hypothetical protein